MNLQILNKKLLSRIFSILSSETRLEALELFEEKKDLMEIATLARMSRSGFQKVVEAFRELGLIERAGHRSYYKLTRKGEKVLKMVRNFGDELEPIEKELTKEKIKALVYGSGLTEEDLTALLKEIEKNEDQ
jgi:predicted transcriptional regulator